MAGDLQPLDEKFAIVGPDGRPTLYFIKWTQQRQIDITEGITLLQLQEYLDVHMLQEGSGIQITPDGSINNSPTIAADVQEILDQISTTRGTVLYRNASDWVGLAPGTAGDFLKTNGAGADPAWATVASGAGALVLITETSPSGTGVVTFSSIPSTYRDLKLIIRGRGTTAATSVAVAVTVNNDTSAIYDSQRVSGSSTTASANNTLAATSWTVGSITASTATAGIASSHEYTIHDYKGTTFQKSGISFTPLKSGTAAGNITMNCTAIYWRSTAAINRVDVTLAAGNFDTGSVVSLYGIM